MKTIAVINDKGGVGKTVTTVNVAAVLGATGHKVLVIDLDRQANATEYLGLPPRASSGSYRILTERCTPEMMVSFIELTEFPGVSMIAAGNDLEHAEIQIAMDVRMPRETRIKRACEALDNQFDYVLIDCPPSLKSVAMNAMVAADFVVIPVMVSQFAIAGINTVLQRVQDVRENFNDQIRAGILQTIAEKTAIQAAVREQITGDNFPTFQTVISKTTRIVESTFAHKPIVYYDVTCSAAQDYINFTDELKGTI